MEYVCIGEYFASDVEFEILVALELVSLEFGELINFIQSKRNFLRIACVITYLYRVVLTSWHLGFSGITRSKPRSKKANSMVNSIFHFFGNFRKKFYILIFFY